MYKFSMIFVLACFFTKAAYTQEDIRNKLNIDPNTHLITYQEVVEEPGSKEKLFNRCIEWLNYFYKNPVAVTRERDMTNGVIRGQHQFPITYIDDQGVKKVAGDILYDFKIELKPDRFRYTVDNFVLKSASRFPVEKWLNKDDPNYDPRWDQYLSQIDDYVRNEWVKSLKEKMKPVVKVEEKSW
jgi:hypothetical protein